MISDHTSARRWAGTLQATCTVVCVLITKRCSPTYHWSESTGDRDDRWHHEDETQEGGRHAEDSGERIVELDTVLLHQVASRGHIR